MQVRIRFTSATTTEVRAMLAALHQITGLKGTRVHVEGPEKWQGTTQPLRPREAAEILAAVEGHDPLTQ